MLPNETIREGRNGLLPEILAWQSEPELQVLCSPAGDLKLRIAHIDIESPIGAPMASVSIALAVLDQPVPAAAESGRETLREALQDASDLELPMVVDA